MTPSGGRGLARRYADDVVAPLLARDLPRLPVALGRLGTGSDVLGLDDERSRDHDWGLRLTLAVPPEAVAEVDAHLQARLPTTYDGRPVRFPLTGDPREHHRVEVTSVRELVRDRTGLDPAAGWDVTDWLSVTGQAALEVTAGSVWRDDTGELTAARERLASYPDELVVVLVAVDWQRLAQELPLAGRAGERGDELGSRVVGARLVDAAVHLGFLLERRWAPYPKWRGTLFAALPRCGALAPTLMAALAAPTWREREAHLAEALRGLYDVQRATGVAVVGPDPLEPFFDRPFLGVRASVTQVLLDAVADPGVRAAFPLGAVEQWSGSVDLLTAADRRAAVTRALRG